ncbi:hypothetical protein SDC9_170054 [bioreactor metagenome]|uniref:Uncharacterized protein n=1 Tax=bioreactor metagenome TaxID=1076179 RepID=A0A645G6Z9_9ZZZZ
MRDARSDCTGHQLMMRRLEFDLFFIFAFFEVQTGTHEWCMQDHVDFIESQPIFNKSFIAIEDCMAKILIESDHFAVAPAAVFFDQVHRAIEMGDCH